MSDLDALEQAFPTAPSPVTAPPDPVMSSAAGDGDVYERRLRSLLHADHGRYAGCLDGDHSYPSDSEASMAVIDAMVLRHFADAEIMATLETSPLFARRVERKGETHARNLYAAEIAKARSQLRPFDRDPGARLAQPAARTVIVRQVTKLEDPPSAAPTETFDENQRPPPTGTDFVSCYVRYALQVTDAPRAAHELMAVIVLSALAGPGPTIPISTSAKGWRLCLWGMYIVNSTVGRKTTTINIARDLIAEILTPKALIEWEGSPQGLLQRLAERDGQACVFARDEYSGLMAQMNRAGGHLAGLSQLLIKAFDGGVLENIRTKKRTQKGGPVEEDTDRVNCPYLPKLTASTWDSFVQRCTIDNVLDGYLARFIFVHGSAKPRPLRLQTASMAAEREALLERARIFYQRCRGLGVIAVDPQVLDAAWQVEQQWLEVAERSSRPDAAGPAMKRLLESVLKVAALFAIGPCEHGTPVVTPANFAVALELGERWRMSTMAVIEALGTTSFMRDVEAVLATVQQYPQGIPVRDLLRRHRTIRQRDFAEILDTLEQREEIEVVEVRGEGRRGRPPRIVYPFGHAPQPEPA
jgi:hypothetical protein